MCLKMMGNKLNYPETLNGMHNSAEKGNSRTIELRCRSAVVNNKMQESPWQLGQRLHDAPLL